MKKRYPVNVSVVREFLSYDPETGVFHWIKNTGYLNKVGRTAGCSTSMGYVQIGLRGNRLLGHRLAWLFMTGDWPKHEVDHIDGNRSNTRWSNLRAADRQQNARNVAIHSDNKSGLKGVSLTRGFKWTAQICIDGRQTNLGRFVSKEEASVAYQQAARRYYGEFARTA